MRHLCKICSGLSITKEMLNGPDLLFNSMCNQHHNESYLDPSEEAFSRRSGPVLHYTMSYTYAPWPDSFHPWRIPILLKHSGVTYLAQSADGKLEGKPCHFCAIILRSLRDCSDIGTEQESSKLPTGELVLFLSLKDRAFVIIAHRGFKYGYPITLSLGTDESCRGSDVSSDSSSGQVFSQIQSWSNDCMHKHLRCAIAKSSVSWLPSRVIDLGPVDGSITPRIREAQGGVGQYITLTHRWTSLTRRSATTMENYESRKKAIDMDSLSLTFRDAFEATRKLGVCFLWIDALCIIQDSSEDWDREASNMRSIYEFAWLNLAVAGSETEDGRMFMKRNARLSRPCKLPNLLLSDHVSEFEGPIYAYLPSEFYAQTVFDGFLTRRGWILQERILSPRTVYFGQEEVFWECSTTSASESIPWGFETDTSRLVKFNSHDLVPTRTAARSEKLSINAASPSKMRRIEDRTVDSEALSPLYEYWYRLVENYTTKELTKSSDKLPAIYGLAQALHKSGMPYTIFSECYQDGVWLLEPASLLWFLEKGSNTHAIKIPGAPSYSWASLDTPIQFMGQDLRSSDTIDLHTASEAVGEFVRALGSDRSFKQSLVSLPNHKTLAIRAQRKASSALLQVEGQLDIATLKIGDEMTILADQDPYPLNRFATLDDCEAILKFKDDNSRSPVVILDRYPDEDLFNWLSFSKNTVWALKLTMSRQPDNVRDVISKAPWMPNLESGATVSTSRYYDFGLLLIPEPEVVKKLKEIQEMLEPWNVKPPPKMRMTDFDWAALIANGTDIGGDAVQVDGSGVPRVKPTDDAGRWTHAQVPKKLHELLGPHNTALRRIGIYRDPASTYDYHKRHVTTVLLA